LLTDNQHNQVFDEEYTFLSPVLLC